MSIGSILVVDDDPEILEFHRKIFSPAGNAELDVLGSRESAEAKTLECLLFSDPSELIADYSRRLKSGGNLPLCIIDMRMPLMNGLTTALRIRELDPAINIVICTAYSDTSPEEIRAKVHGGVFFVRKPFIVGEFLLLVHSLVENWNVQRELELKRAECAAQCKKLFQILEGTRTGTWDWDIPGGAVEINERWAKMLGYTLKELEPVSISTWTSLCHPDDLSRSNLLLQEIFSRKTAYYDCECRMRHKDGSWVWVKDRGKVMRWSPDGKPLRMAGTHSDITTIKRQEEALAESEMRWRVAIEGTGDGIYDWDIASGTGFYSRQWKEMLGHSDEEIGTGVEEWEGRIHPDDKEQTMAAVRELLDGTTQLYSHEHRLRCKDGSWKWIHSRGIVMSRDVEGRPLRVLGTHSDVTEMRQAAEIKSRLISMASHEFRTPLATIRLAADLLATCRDKMDEAGIQRTLQSILSTADYMTGVVADVLDLGSITRDWQPQALTEFPLGDFLRQIAGDFHCATAATPAITFEWDGIPAIGTGIPALLKRAVNNLLDNAVKYSPPGMPVVLRLQREGDEALIQVEDQGVGIPEEDRSFLYDPFFRASNTESIPGTGLGLTIVAEALHRINGTLEYANRPEGGSVFSIRLPLAAEAAAAGTSATARRHGSCST